MINPFTRHPTSVNETYLQHMRTALRYSARFSLGAVAVLVHAFFPFLFESTGRRLIMEMHQSLLDDGRRSS